MVGGAKTLVVILVAFFLWFPVSLAGDFPALTGRVVDNAGLLGAQQEKALVRSLRKHEEATSNQVVVATVESLHGYPIDDYANRLFRRWELGQADQDNGVLFLVAPNERKVRIEVGYGLEGTLTDAQAKIIIEQDIIPAFKRKDYASGIKRGAASVLGILSGNKAMLRPVGNVYDKYGQWIYIGFLFVVLLILLFLNKDKEEETRSSTWRLRLRSDSSFNCFFKFVKFVGGGGSSGGGGASGSW